MSSAIEPVGEWRDRLGGDRRAGAVDDASGSREWAYGRGAVYPHPHPPGDCLAPPMVAPFPREFRLDRHADFDARRPSFATSRSRFPVRGPRTQSGSIHHGRNITGRGVSRCVALSRKIRVSGFARNTAEPSRVSSHLSTESAPSPVSSLLMTSGTRRGLLSSDRAGYPPRVSALLLPLLRKRASGATSAPVAFLVRRDSLAASRSRSAPQAPDSRRTRPSPPPAVATPAHHSPGFDYSPSSPQLSGSGGREKTCPTASKKLVAPRTSGVVPRAKGGWPPRDAG